MREREYANDFLSLAQREVRTCQRNLDAGGSPDFWRWRLEPFAKRLEAAAAIVRMQLAALPAPTPQPVDDEKGRER